ncbi:MAG TPA: ABC transporter permease subunit [Ilumatobacter sp.]|nr:ABC transporter permease subunit [Ilumatobacter sp.]
MSASAAGRRRLSNVIVPIATVLVCAVYFVLPLIAMTRFSFQSIPVINLRWSNLTSRWSFDPVVEPFRDEQLRSAMYLSIKLAVATVFATMALLIPTTVWVNLRLPRMRSIIEFLTVLPYVIPPIALVAGIRVVQPHARWFLNSHYSLVPFYVVLALPFTYRALDAGMRALDLKTLVDASRSLGAGWGTTLRRAIIPNLRTSIVSASFLTATVVLGEYTIASVLLKPTLTQELVVFQQSNGQQGTAMSLLLLVATTLLLGVLTIVTRKRGGASVTPV